MIFVIELLLEAFLIYKVWTERDRTRLFLWFMSAMILLYPNLKIMQGTPAVNWMFPVVCLLRIIKDKELKKCWKNFPLKYIYGAIQNPMNTYKYVVITYCMT